MANFRGILTGAALAKFDPSLGVLTGATLIFFGSDDVSSLTLTNTSATSQTFDFTDSSNITFGATNSAHAADAFTGESLDIFDTGIGASTATLPTTPGPLTLGSDLTPVCPESTPSAACSAVSYTPPDVIDSNTDPVNGFSIATGIGGVTGVVKNITGGDLLNYIGAATTFTLGGATKNLTTFSGGGGNIALAINTNATVNAEIDYTYTVPGPPGTPEPATFALFSGALLAIGLYRKRAVR